MLFYGLGYTIAFEVTKAVKLAVILVGGNFLRVASKRKLLLPPLCCLMLRSDTEVT